MAEWSDVLIPLAVALTQRNAKGGAFLEGYQRSSLLQDELERRREQDARQAALQQASLDNIQADNERAELQLGLQAQRDALARLQAYESSIGTRGEHLAQFADDPLQAQNQLAVEAFQRAPLYGVPPQAAGGLLPNMSGMISQRDQKAAKALVDDFDKTYGPQAAEVEPGYTIGYGRFSGRLMTDVRKLAQAFPPPPPAKIKRSLQSKEMLRGGQRAVVNFDPDTGEYFDVQGQRVTDIAPIPPVSATQSGTGDYRKIATFNQIAGAYERSPLVRAADRTVVLDDAIKTIEQNPSDPASQLRLAYSYIQALDTYQSAVREGELGNLGVLGTRWQAWQVQLNRVVSEGAFMPPEVARNIAQDAKQLVQVISSGAARKQQEFGSRARVSGVGDMWEAFVSGAAPAPAGGQASPTGRFEILSVK